MIPSVEVISALFRHHLIKTISLSGTLKKLAMLKRNANKRHMRLPPCQGPYEVFGEKSLGKYLLKEVSNYLTDSTASAERLEKWSTEWCLELTLADNYLYQLNII